MEKTDNLTDKELIIWKAAQLGRIEQEIKAKGERTPLDEDKLIALGLMSNYYLSVADEYDNLVKHLRKEYSQQ